MNVKADFQPISSEVSQTVATPSEAPDQIVVIGGGPVGMRAANELARRGRHVILFNAERWAPYNRVQLTPLLAGEAQIGSIYLSEDRGADGRIDRYDGVSVVEIDKDAREILTSTNRVVPYHNLILALGSRAFIPSIPGADLPGVFVFRNMNHAEALIARAMTARKVAVIGGGLLGLEAARGMANRGAKVTVIEHESHLMPRQLDGAAGAVLKDRIADLGVDVLTQKRVTEIVGEGRVERILLNDGPPVEADTVIICTGVRSNTHLASAIDLRVGRGVLIDDQMRTSDPHIYAIGECAEHDGVVHGLVGPGYEQAQIAVDAICGDDAARYHGSTPATKLKVLGADVFSMGDFETIEQQTGVTSLIWRDDAAGLYRRILIRRGRLMAVLGVGDWPEATRLQQALADRCVVGPIGRLRFQRTGRLWPENDVGVVAWPEEAIVCNCTGVTKRAIGDAIVAGAADIDQIRAKTSANSVCGTCKPLVLDLLGAGAAPPEPVKWWRQLLWLSGAAALLAPATLVLPRVPLSDTFVIGDLRFNLWFDNIWKQWSGYILLGVTVAAAALGLRRRIGIFRRLGGYDAWRYVHLGIGVIAGIGLFAHTGFRLGSGLNFWLMASFSASLIFGAIAGLTTGGEHKLLENGVGKATLPPRTIPHWVHVLALWPLPVLLAIHILSVYSY